MIKMRVAQAASSEYYSKWGEPGDQRKGDTSKDTFTGELDIVNWSGNWNYCFRAFDPKKAEQIAAFMEAACKNAYIGYSQNNGASPRTTLYDEVSKNGWNAAKVNVKVNCDCSSLVACACNAAGIKVSKDMWTGDEYKLLSETGAFEILVDSAHTKTGDFLRRGDILLRSGHTCVAIDDGIELDPYQYVATGDVNLRKGAGTQYAKIKVIPKGATVYVMTLNGTWAQVDYAGDIGYASLRYLGEVRKMTAVDDLWMRTGAGVIFPKIQVIPKGQTVQATGFTRKYLGTTWYQIVYNGRTGWGSGKLLK